MPDSVSDQFGRNKLSLLSACGSLASLTALAIVLLDRVASRERVDPQMAAWRLIFLIMSLFAIAGFGLFTFYWAKSAVQSVSRSGHAKALLVTLQVLIGLVVIGICIDALFATLYWRPWLMHISELLRFFRSYIAG